MLLTRSQAASFRRALEADGAKPDDLLNVRYLLAQLLEKQEQHDEAMAQYRLIYEANPLFRDVAERIERASQNGRGGSGIRSRLMAWWRSPTSRRR